MFSHQDRRALQRIERQLVSEDPQFAVQFRRRRPEDLWVMFGGIGLVALGLIMVLVGVATFSAALILIFAAVALVGWALISHQGPTLRRSRPRARR
ncbi:DUF3040 domain-containing protein [Pseudonocardia pini]|uniref:DUF3040 domain-containing protein n=1 Tax=Pseudonocardia pini TaxID=2758030 RepID=UPI0015F00184|nr:DUF3040 domain-containing protein [Pseudonocardia pini]